MSTNTHFSTSKDTLPQSQIDALREYLTRPRGEDAEIPHLTSRRATRSTTRAKRNSSALDLAVPHQDKEPVWGEWIQGISTVENDTLNEQPEQPNEPQESEPSDWHVHSDQSERPEQPEQLVKLDQREQQDEQEQREQQEAQGQSEDNQRHPDASTEAPRTDFLPRPPSGILAMTSPIEIGRPSSKLKELLARRQTAALASKIQQKGSVSMIGSEISREDVTDTTGDKSQDEDKEDGVDNSVSEVHHSGQINDKGKGSSNGEDDDTSQVEDKGPATTSPIEGVNPSFHSDAKLRRHIRRRVAAKAHRKGIFPASGSILAKGEVSERNDKGEHEPRGEASQADAGGERVEVDSSGEIRDKGDHIEKGEDDDQSEVNKKDKGVFSAHGRERTKAWADTDTESDFLDTEYISASNTAASVQDDRKGKAEITSTKDAVPEDWFLAAEPSSGEDSKVAGNARGKRKTGLIDTNSKGYDHEWRRGQKFTASGRPEPIADWWLKPPPTDVEVQRLLEGGKGQAKGKGKVRETTSMPTNVSVQGGPEAGNREAKGKDKVGESGKTERPDADVTPSSQGTSPWAQKPTSTGTAAILTGGSEGGSHPTPRPVMTILKRKKDEEKGKGTVNADSETSNVDSHLSDGADLRHHYTPTIRAHSKREEEERRDSQADSNTSKSSIIADEGQELKASSSSKDDRRIKMDWDIRPPSNLIDSQKALKKAPAPRPPERPVSIVWSQMQVSGRVDSQLNEEEWPTYSQALQQRPSGPTQSHPAFMSGDASQSLAPVPATHPTNSATQPMYYVQYLQYPGVPTGDEAPQQPVAYAEWESRQDSDGHYSPLGVSSGYPLQAQGGQGGSQPVPFPVLYGNMMAPPGFAPDPPGNSQNFPQQRWALVQVPMYYPYPDPSPSADGGGPGIDSPPQQAMFVEPSSMPAHLPQGYSQQPSQPSIPSSNDGGGSWIEVRRDRAAGHAPHRRPRQGQIASASRSSQPSSWWT